MLMRRKGAQTIMLSILYLLVVFAFISVTYSWFSINESASAEGSSIQVVNDYEMDINWYDDEGSEIDSEFIEYLDSYDQERTRYISMQNTGILDLYGFMSFDTSGLSYEFFLSRFTYTLSEIQAINNAGLGRILKGEGAPSSEAGTLNHYYINTLNDGFYKKTSSGWFLFNATISASKPSSPGTEGDYYLYNSSNYPILYYYTNSEWEIVAYDDDATPLDLYLTENITLGSETQVSTGDLADLAKELVGDSSNSGIGVYLKGIGGYNYGDGGTRFWKFDYTVETSTVTSPNAGAENSLFIKPRAHITFGEVYSVDPIEGPIWLVTNNTELAAALHATTGAADRHTVRLTSSLSYTGDLTIYNSITLDLNGYDLTINGNLTYQASTIYNSVFLHIPSGSDFSAVNLNITTSYGGRLYLDMGDGGTATISNNINIDAPDTSVAIYGDNSTNQLQVSGVINVDTSHDVVDEQRLISARGLIFNDIKTNSASIVITASANGNTSRIYVSEHSLIGSITAEASGGGEEVSKVQIANLGSVGYIDLSEVVVGEDGYSIDVYFGGVSTAAGANKIKLPALATSSNTYVEVSTTADVITSDISGLSSYIRVVGDAVTNVTSLNEFSVTGATGFTDDDIARPYYWVRFDLATDEVVQVRKLGTIASLFSDVLYDFEPVDTSTTYFEGWFDANSVEFVRNWAVTEDMVLTPLILDVDYTLRYDLDSGIIDSYNSKEAMVNDFLDDYTDFYNYANSTSLSRFDLLISGDSGYNSSTALIDRFDNTNATPLDFFNDNTLRAKWLWMIEYIMSIRDAASMDNTYFEDLLDGTLGDSGDGHNIVKYEIWGFLASRKHTTWPISMDYTVFGNSYDYVFFASYPYRYSSIGFAQGGTSFTLTLPTPQRRGSYIIGGNTYGYIFGGWYEDSSYTTLFGDAGDTVTYNDLVALLSGTTVTLYAKWLPGVAKVTFTDKTEDYYNSFEAAITAANLDVGSTVELLLNTSIETAITATAITIDLGIYYLTVNDDFTIASGTLEGERAYIIAGTDTSKLVINNSVTISEGVKPWSVAGNPINEFVIGGVQVTDIDYTASSGDWTTTKRQVLFMYWEDGDDTNSITSDLVLKISSIQVVTSGNTATAPSDPTLSGWTFMGWNKYSGGNLITTVGGYLYVGSSVTKAGSAFNFSTTITDSTVLVAWFKDSVSYSIEGSIADATDDVYFGELSTVRIVDETGYRLVGWEYTNDVSGEEFECGVPYTYQAYLPHDALLIAVWMPVEYVVVFDSNGGSGLMNPAYQEFVYNVEDDLYANAFTKAGYEFIEWNTSADGSGTSFLDEATIFEGTSVTLNHGTTVVLYAQWDVATYSITFNNNGGSGSMNNQSLTYGDIDALTANTFTKAGYSFRGWSMGVAGIYIDFYEGATLSNLQLVDLMDGGTSATLYAVWGQDLYIISLSSDGTVTNYVKLVSSTIAPGLTKTGYTFGGWYLDSGFTQLGQSAMNITVTTDLMYYAKWTANTYTLSFNSNGGTEASPTSKSVTYDSAVGTLATTSRTGYNFTEWNTASNGSGKAYSSSTVYTVADNTTVYAIWSIITYSITYYSVDAYSGSTQLFTYNTRSLTPSTYTIESGASLPSSVSGSSWTHEGWYSTAPDYDTYGFSGSAVTSISVGETGNVTYYAKMKAPRGTTYSNGSTNATNFISYLYDQRINAPAAPLITYNADANTKWKIRSLHAVDRIALQVSSYPFDGFTFKAHTTITSSNSSVMQLRSGSYNTIDSLASGWSWMTITFKNKTGWTGIKVRICLYVIPEVLMRIAVWNYIGGSQSIIDSAFRGTITGEYSVKRTGYDARRFRVQVYDLAGNALDMGINASQAWNYLGTSADPPIQITSHANYEAGVSLTSGSGSAKVTAVNNNTSPKISIAKSISCSYP